MKHPTLKRLATLALALALFLKPLGILALQVAPEHNFTISLPFDSAGQPITRLDIRFYWTPGLTFLSGSSTSMGSMTVSNYGGTALGTFTTGTAVTSGSVILQFKAQPDADEEQAVLVEGITGADTVSGEENIHAGMSGRHEILVSLDNETWPDEWILDTPATHDAPGQEHRVSSLGRYEYRTIPTLEIIWSEWTVITPASYDAEGLERRVNSLDANQFEERAIPKLPLVWGEWTVITPATCDLPGLERRVNTLDTAMSETREIPALGHAAAEWVISKLPTFTEPGRKNLPGGRRHPCVTDPAHPGAA